MIFTSSGICTCGFQPNRDLAFDASPMTASTSAGRQIAFVESNVFLPVEADLIEGQGEEFAHRVTRSP